MKVEEIKTIVKLMAENDLTEFKIESQEYNLCIKRGGAAPAPVATPVAPAPAANAPANGEKVLSPFPGLIKNLLVEEGTTVKKDQPILVLEAMKMDNDITAPCDGVVSFRVAKGANVESDSVLAIIG